MKNKLLIGIISGAVIYLLCLLTLSGTHKIDNEFSYYDNIDFDFIIPKPWYSQIDEIEKLDFIDKVTPYYMTNKSISGNNIKIDFFIVEKNANLDKTPYSSTLLLKGKLSSVGEAVIDEKAQRTLNANLGDKITVTFGNEQCTFMISGIVRTNNFASKPTALIYFADGVKQGIKNSVKKLSYSGAYVDAIDIAKAEDYFNKSYRPIGKIGDRNWYDDEDSYEYMKKSIESMEVSKEITNTALLKANSVSKYTESTKSNIGILAITLVIDFVLYVLLWIIYLIGSSKTYRKRINNGEKVAEIVKEFRLGAFVTLFICSLFLIVSHAFIGKTSVIALVLVNIIAFAIINAQASKIITKK